MGRVGIAFRLFFKALGNPAFAEAGARLLDGQAAAAPAAAPATAKAAAEPASSRPAAARSDALTLLSVLQREARLVDFLKENISAFDNAQIGAAVRDVHRDAGAVLDRLFSLRPVMSEAEGTAVSIASGTDAARVRLTGNVTGQSPYRGTLRHSGWEASKTQLPEWNGSAAAANVVAPAEVELA
ncbi:MAG TPA: DUF2760 domain-containing protein [Tepidisphaeraceae bacterium]|jgi:hypothetical protein|nr:DUF2760 domain-containing protein [Tepidisphaeraceae bacterium]